MIVLRWLLVLLRNVDFFFKMFFFKGCMVFLSGFEEFYMKEKLISVFNL